MRGLAALGIAGLVWAAAPVAPVTPPGGAVDGVVAQITIPPGAITVGDTVIMKLTVSHPPGATFDYPDAARLAAPAQEGEDGGASPPRFMVEEVRPIESKPPHPGETSWSIRVRPFVPGDLKIPALTLTYRLPGSSATRSVSTEAINLHVMSVLKGEKEDASDIKGPWWIPRAWWPWIVAALGLLAALAVLRAVWRRLRRRKPAVRPVAPAAPAAPPESAYDRALRELDRLLASGLLESGRIKEFHVGLSEIVKRFLGAHYGFDALDRTTAEVLADLSRPTAGTGVRDRARQFLEACDLVKFAKHRPGLDEIDETIESARAMIEIGRPRAAESAGGVAA